MHFGQAGDDEEDDVDKRYMRFGCSGVEDVGKRYMRCINMFALVLLKAITLI